MIYVVSVFLEDDLRGSRLICMKAFANDLDAFMHKSKMLKKYYQLNYIIDLTELEVE